MGDGQDEYACFYAAITSNQNLADPEPASGCISWSAPAQLLYENKQCTQGTKSDLTLSAVDVSTNQDSLTTLCEGETATFNIDINHPAIDDHGLLDGSYQCDQQRELFSYLVIEYKNSATSSLPVRHFLADIAQAQVVSERSYHWAHSQRFRERKFCSTIYLCSYKRLFYIG